MPYMEVARDKPRKVVNLVPPVANAQRSYRQIVKGDNNTASNDARMSSPKRVVVKFVSNCNVKIVFPGSSNRNRGSA
jgi:hypothetical protein